MYQLKKLSLQEVASGVMGLVIAFMIWGPLTRVAAKRKFFLEKASIDSEPEHQTGIRERRVPVDVVYQDGDGIEKRIHVRSEYSMIVFNHTTSQFAIFENRVKRS